MQSNQSINKKFSGEQIPLVVSSRWPITPAGRLVYVLEHEPTGRRVAWIRGPVSICKDTSVHRVAIFECYGPNACERCVFERSMGRLKIEEPIETAEFEMRSMCTGRLGERAYSSTPLCESCYLQGMNAENARHVRIVNRIKHSKTRHDAFVDAVDTEE